VSFTEILVGGVWGHTDTCSIKKRHDFLLGQKILRLMHGAEKPALLHALSPTRRHVRSDMCCTITVQQVCTLAGINLKLMEIQEEPPQHGIFVKDTSPTIPRLDLSQLGRAPQAGHLLREPEVYDVFTLDTPGSASLRQEEGGSSKPADLVTETEAFSRLLLAEPATSTTRAMAGSPQRKALAPRLLRSQRSYGYSPAQLRDIVENNGMLVGRLERTLAAKPKAETTTAEHDRVSWLTCYSIFSRTLCMHQKL
jgi:hypothetical protein